MLFKIYSFWFIWLTTVAVISEAGIFANGIKKVIIEDAHICAGYVDLPWVLHGSMRKFNRTHQAISGNITIDRPLDDRLSVNIEAQKWGEGGWKANALRFQKNEACTTLNEFIGQAWRDVCTAAGIDPGTCPIPQGTYSIEDLFVDGSSSRLIFMLGRFKYIMSIWQRNLILFCLEIQVMITAPI